VNLKNFFAELKRRNVYKVAIAYGVVAWLLMQAASILFPTFEAPPWTMKVFVAMTALGFPIALILAWAFELTPEGIKRTDEIEPGRRPPNRAWIYVVVIAGAISVGLFFLGRYTASTKLSGSANAAAKSIAVLPFENLSKDEENAFFADGVQDQIRTALAKVADLKVISRTSVMQYKNASTRNLRDIARQLGVAHVLEGSVQRAGGKVRVNAQLINARSDAHEWAENYDRPVDDVFAIQSEIAKAIADQLQAQISPREKAAMSQAPTNDLEANKLYVQAKELESSSFFEPNEKQGWLEAVRLLEEAVTRDPHFLLAYCLLGQVHLDLYWYGDDHTSTRRELAHAVIQNASHLQPDAGEVHFVLALYAYCGFLDYERARTELDLALRALPNDADIYKLIAAIDRRQGRWNEATRNFERAVELDPRNYGVVWETARTYQAMRSYPDSSRLYARAIAISPRQYSARIELALNPLFERADVQPLRAELSKILTEEPRIAEKIADYLFDCALWDRDPEAATYALGVMPPQGMQDSNVLSPREWFAGLAARTFGDAAAARSAFTAARVIVEKVVREQPDYVRAWTRLGLIDAGLGHKDDAVWEGRHACELRPISKDAFEGPMLVMNLAIIYAWTGEKDLALEQLAILGQLPAGLYLTYGQLKLDPRFDSLRGDPRFEKIVASLAPKGSSPQAR
jgi:TolB-like protein/Tfp pilus assembly protein PilF